MAESQKETNFLKDFQIPDYILVPEPKCEIHHRPKWPVIIFINSKSGGQLGGDLLNTYRSVLNRNQVTFFGISYLVMFRIQIVVRLTLKLQNFRFLIWGKKLRIRCCAESMSILKGLRLKEMTLLNILSSI